MATSTALSAFQSHVHEYYTCFVFAADGLQKFASGIPLDPAKYPNQQIYIGDADPNEGKPAQSVMSAAQAVTNAQKDGAFPDILAKALLVSLYAEWDERFRHQIAEEFKVEAKQVTSDLMGDLRRVRHWIVHSKSIVGPDVGKLRVLPWKLTEGVKLHVSSSMFREFVDRVNDMTVAIAT